MMEHTKEPWGLNSLCRIFGNGGLVADCKTLFYSNDSANASRIVACVNACVGLSNELLQTEGYTIKAELDSLDEQIELRMKAEKRINDLELEIKLLKIKVNNK